MMLLLLATCFLAYANGANDNFKGVASLFGSRTASYRTSIVWATITTFAGSVASIFLAQMLLTRFSGKGLVPDDVVRSEQFVLAVAFGAGLTVILATITGFPISTTHALTGAIIGAGMLATGGQAHLAALGKGFVLPLLLSPILAVLLAGPLYLLFRQARARLGVSKEWCVCVEGQFVALPQTASGAAFQVAAAPEITVGDRSACAERYAGEIFGISSQKLLNTAHFLSAGLVSFARGMNDTPKMAAMLLILPALGAQGGTLTTAVAIALGGLLSAQKVAQTMSKKIVSMNHGQGFAANLSTGILVILASKYGLPVSTTHVSVGSLLGIGMTNHSADLRVVRNIVLSWILTLPCAVLLAALCYEITHH